MTLLFSKKLQHSTIKNGAILSHGFGCLCDSENSPKNSPNEDRMKFIEDAHAARDWLKNTPIPVSGEALVKTCEISSQNNQAVDFEEKKSGAFLYENAFGQVVPKISEMGEYAFDKFFDFEPKAKKEPDNSARKAVNFSILSVLRKKQKNVPRCEDLKLLDFNGTDFKTVRAYDDLTGQIFYYSVKGKGGNKKFIPQKLPSDALIERFSLQKVMAALLPKFRVSKCLRVVQRDSSGISVYKSLAHSTISLSNLQTCGSVWHCPVCASKISERRRVEMNQANESHKTAGGSLLFVTRTTPHYKTDSLFDIRTKFAKADGYLKNHRDYRNLMKSHGVSLGSIKAKELTVSDANGWHLHVHEVYFIDAGAFEGAAVSDNPEYVAFIETFRAGLYKRWKASAVKAGFDEPSEKHGLQVQNGDFAADYVSKWGVEPTDGNWNASSELTKAHIKDSKKGYTPFGLIRLYDETRDPALIPIIQEYAESMHGQRQLVWSRGLKAHFAIEEVDDEALVEEKEDDAVEIGVISPDQWKFVVKNDLRTDFFLLAAVGWDVLTNYLYSFDGYPQEFSLIPPLENS